MRNTKNNNNKVFLLTVIALLLVFLISFFLLVLHLWEKQHGTFTGPDFGKTSVKYNGVDYVLKDNVETFLIIGLDKFEEDTAADSYNNDQQADFLLLVVFDNVSEKFTAIHINRDTMANVNILGVAGNKIDTVVKQIALAHTYGNGRDVSCRNTADSVSDLLLGVKVDHYISLTMDSVAILNDLVGGVEVTVLDDFTGIDDTLVEGETVTLSGEHALNYIRARYGLEDSSNIRRMERQRQYIDSLYKKTQECIENDDEFIIEASLKMSDYIVSDRSATQLQTLVKKFNEYEFDEIRTIDGESKTGEQFMEFYPDEDSIKKMVIELFYKPET